MKIKINDNWTIKTDAYNYVLCKMGVCNKGEHLGELVSSKEHYFPTLAQALRFAVEKQILTSEAEDWGGVCGMIDDLGCDILEAIEKTGIENCAVQ